MVYSQTQDKRFGCFVIFWSFYKHALHGWFISTLLSIIISNALSLSADCTLARLVCLISFRYLLHYPSPFSFCPRKQAIISYSL